MYGKEQRVPGRHYRFCIIIASMDSVTFSCAEGRDKLEMAIGNWKPRRLSEWTRQFHSRFLGFRDATHGHRSEATSYFSNVALLLSHCHTVPK